MNKRNSGKVECRAKKTLGNIPDRWMFDKKSSKLYMFFKKGGTSYLIFARALVSPNYGSFTTGITGDGKEYILLASNMGHLKVAA